MWRCRRRPSTSRSSTASPKSRSSSAAREEVATMTGRTADGRIETVTDRAGRLAGRQLRLRRDAGAARHRADHRARRAARHRARRWPGAFPERASRRLRASEAARDEHAGLAKIARGCRSTAGSRRPRSRSRAAPRGCCISLGFCCVSELPLPSGPPRRSRRARRATAKSGSSRSSPRWRISAPTRNGWTTGCIATGCSSPPRSKCRARFFRPDTGLIVADAFGAEIICEAPEHRLPAVDPQEHDAALRARRVAAAAVADRSGRALRVGTLAGSRGHGRASQGVVRRHRPCCSSGAPARRGAARGRSPARPFP